MQDRIDNPFRGRGLPGLGPLPISTTDGVARLLSRCPVHNETPLFEMPGLARRAGVDRVSVKDERPRMGLGSFKALGAAHAIARAAAETVEGGDWARALEGHVFVTASAGNHGLSVAAGARVFGARAVVFLARTVPDSFAAALAAKGAEPVRAGATYEESMEAAEKVATDNGWTLLSDSSWPGYTDWPRRVMEGYLQMAAEAVGQIAAPPTHVLLQAGVGGMAAAVAAHLRLVWGDAPRIVIIEPATAPALLDSIRGERVVTSRGPPSCMGRLDCKTPSLIALAGLSRDADQFVTLADDEVEEAIRTLAAGGLETSPSGGAGLAALLCGLKLGPEARVLAFVTEGAVDG